MRIWQQEETGRSDMESARKSKTESKTESAMESTGKSDGKSDGESDGETSGESGMKNDGEMTGERITALILAAGKGQRMGSDIKKQYMLIMGKPVLSYSLQAFSDSAVDDIVIVTGADDISYVKTEIVEKYGFQKVRAVVAGGAERYDSVYAGLQACEGSTYVLIHDAARPLISGDVIRQAILGVKEYQAIVIGVPSKDTIKIVDEAGYAADTPPRKNLWIVQTPQAFHYEQICAAYDRMKADAHPRKQITDDAMVMEEYGNLPVRLVMGEYDNIKITTPEDIPLAETFLRRRR